MKEVGVSKRATKSIAQILYFIREEYHSEETSLKFSSDLKKAIDELSLNYSLYTVCKNKMFAIKKLHCFVFKKKWTVAYKLNKNKVVVYYIVNGKLLK